MFYLRWIFLFSLFIFSGFSLAAEDSGELEYSDLERSDSFEVLEDSGLEIEAPSFLNSKKEKLNSYELYPGVVRLILEDRSGAGTGFFIRPDILATARHVAVEGPLYFRDPSTGDHVLTEVLGISDKYDLALLKAINYESEDFYSVGSLEEGEMNDYLMRVMAELSTDLPYEVGKGDAVIMTGFPHGSFHIAKGIMTRGKGQFIFAAASSRIDKRKSGFKGMSGGPVFSKDRELIGVVAAQIEHGSIWPYEIYEIGFVPVEHLRNLIRRAENGKILSPELQQKIITTIFQITKHKKYSYYFRNKISDH